MHNLNIHYGERLILVCEGDNFP